MQEQLQIDPEFQSKIPPLTEEEYELLEENILRDGEILNPLIVWKGYIGKLTKKQMELIDQAARISLGLGGDAA